jgi:hypothetical protein
VSSLVKAPKCWTNDLDGISRGEQPRAAVAYIIDAKQRYFDTAIENGRYLWQEPSFFSTAIRKPRPFCTSGSLSAERRPKRPTGLASSAAARA